VTRGTSQIPKQKKTTTTPHDHSPSPSKTSFRLVRLRATPALRAPGRLRDPAAALSTLERDTPECVIPLQPIARLRRRKRIRPLRVRPLTLTFHAPAGRRPLRPIKVRPLLPARCCFPVSIRPPARAAYDPQRVRRVSPNRPRHTSLPASSDEPTCSPRPHAGPRRNASPLVSSSSGAVLPPRTICNSLHRLDARPPRRRISAATRSAPLPGLSPNPTSPGPLSRCPPDMHMPQPRVAAERPPTLL